MALKVGTLFVSFVAKTKAFEAGVNTARTRLNTFTTSLNKSKVASRLLGATLGFVGTRQVLDFTKRTLEQLDAQAKLARTLKISQASLVAYQIAGMEAGLSIEEVNKAVAFFNKTLGETTTNISTEGKVAFKLLGLQFRELVKLQPEEAMMRVIEGLKGIEDASKRMAITRRLFGRQSELVNFTETAPERFKQLRRLAIETGLAFDDGMTKPIEELNDSLAELTRLLTGVANRLAVLKAPEALKFVRGLIPQQLSPDASRTRQFLNHPLIRAINAAGEVVGRATRTTVPGIGGGNTVIERLLGDIRNSVRGGTKVAQ